MGMVRLDSKFPARETREFEFTYTRPTGTARREAKRAARGLWAPKSRPRKPKRKRRGPVSPVGETGKPAGKAPKGRKRARKEIPGPTPPSVSMDLTKLSGVSAEVEKKRAISAALLKSAAFVEPSEWSSAIRGILSGWGVGMEIDAAIQHYRDRKRAEAEAARVQKITAGPPQRPSMRANYGYSPQEIA